MYVEKNCLNYVQNITEFLNYMSHHSLQVQVKFMVDSTLVYLQSAYICY